MIDFESVIKRVVRGRLEEVTAEELAAAYSRISERMKSEADRLALSVLSYYEVSQDQRRIIIEVKKDIPKP